MEYTTRTLNSSDSASVSTVLMWILILLLAILLIALLARMYINLQGDNKIFYSEEGAINLRVDKLPDIRIATKNCKDFQLTVADNVMVISYANPFGGVKEFRCNIVGDPVKKGFIMKFKEEDFKKLCYHLKPGNIAIYKNKIIFNYNLAVRAKLNYLKKEV